MNVKPPDVSLKAMSLTGLAQPVRAATLPDLESHSEAMSVVDTTEWRRSIGLGYDSLVEDNKFRNWQHFPLGGKHSLEGGAPKKKLGLDEQVSK